MLKRERNRQREGAPPLQKQRQEQEYSITMERLDFWYIDKAGTVHYKLNEAFHLGARRIMV